jgi:ubiquinone/menaquinone biosynthesis C-methylase UbiE
VLLPAQRRADVHATGPLRVLDLGAGNGWLAHRAALGGADALALDVRDDRVDGLGAAPPRSPMARVAGSFEAIPVAANAFDVVVFNASLHYAENLREALREARRVARTGATIVVLDTPFYRHAADGEAMVREKRLDAERRFGTRANALLALAFVARVVRPLARETGRPLRILDLGAGNGWLSYRMMTIGHEATAVDVRDDAVDGLGAAAGYDPHLPKPFQRFVASFDALPVRGGSHDLAVFNASLHYALDLAATLREAVRAVRADGRIAILDSPFYRRAADGEAMVAEKRRHAAERFGARADALVSLPFIEYLTRARLAEASAPLGLRWKRHRVRYPLGYELRPVIARLRGRRTPSRFDLWECTVP